MFKNYPVRSRNVQKWLEVSKIFKNVQYVLVPKMFRNVEKWPEMTQDVQKYLKMSTDIQTLKMSV